MQDRYTEKEFWDDHWRGVQLPVEMRMMRFEHSHNRILDAFERHLPKGSGLSALEIGGAPGQYLAYVARKYGYAGAVLDYSDVGCAAARRNFELLGMPVDVRHGDLFEDQPDFGPFDVVFSLGLIEHFDDLERVMARHVRLAKPGGIVVVGCPNFNGINGWFLERLAPDLLAKHNRAMMDLQVWTKFERSLGLTVLDKSCVGGLAPHVFDRWEQRSGKNALLRGAAKALKLGARWKWASRIDSPSWSHYLLAAYRAP